MMKKALLSILIILGLSYSTQRVADSKSLEQLKNLNISTALKNLPNICRYRFLSKTTNKTKRLTLIRSGTRYGGIKSDIEGMDEIIKILSKDPSLIFSKDFGLNKLKCHNFGAPNWFGYPFRARWDEIQYNSQTRSFEIPKNRLVYGRYPIELYFGHQTFVLLSKPYDDKTYGSELSAWEKGEYKFNKAYLNNISSLHPIDKENLKFLVKVITLNSNIELPASADKKTRKAFKINFGNLKTAYNQLQNNESYQFVRKINQARMVFKILLLLL